MGIPSESLCTIQREEKGGILCLDMCIGTDSHVGQDECTVFFGDKSTSLVWRAQVRVGSGLCGSRLSSGSKITKSKNCVIQISSTPGPRPVCMLYYQPQSQLVHFRSAELTGYSCRRRARRRLANISRRLANRVINAFITKVHFYRAEKKNCK